MHTKHYHCYQRIPFIDKEINPLSINKNHLRSITSKWRYFKIIFKEEGQNMFTEDKNEK